MPDPTTGAPIAHCPWCSAPLTQAGLQNCPACGATLTSSSAGDTDVPGVTTLDTEAILRARSGPRRPSRLVSFITGEVGDEAGVPGSPESLAPPSEAVRREMLRMELAAEVADLEAEAQAMAADEAVDTGLPVSRTPMGETLEAAEDAVQAAEAPLGAEPAAAATGADGASPA